LYVEVLPVPNVPDCKKLEMSFHPPIVKYWCSHNFLLLSLVTYVDLCWCGKMCSPHSKNGQKIF
jgi:hypothetical protein